LMKLWKPNSAFNDPFLTTGKSIPFIRYIKARNKCVIKQSLQSLLHDSNEQKK
jgi:hypothetical protein